MAAKKSASTQPTKTYTVVSPLDHDGDSYAVGDPVELTEAQAAPVPRVSAAPAFHGSGL